MVNIERGEDGMAALSIQPIESIEMALVEGRALLREALGRILAGHFPERRIAVYSSLAEFISSLEKKGNIPDVVLFSGGSRPLDDPFYQQAIDEITAVTQSKIVLLVDQLEMNPIPSWCRERTSGAVPITFNANQLAACIRLVQAGLQYFLPSQAADLNESRHREKEEQADADFLHCVRELTPRQKEVMKYIYLGKSNKVIAAELELCESTIKVHVREVMKRLHATNRTHAAYLVSTAYHELFGKDDEVQSEGVPGE